MNKTSFLEKIIFFRKHIEMFLFENNYESVTAFISGMDFSLDGNALKGFREWLITQYNINSNLSWMGIIDCAYINKIEEKKNKIDFLFDILEKYLMNTQ